MHFLLALCLWLAPNMAQAEELTAFIAASLTDAMKDVSVQWTQAGHQPLRMSFGSSSTLARQIEQGAPVNLFASADERWMNYLAEKNLIAPDTRKARLGNELVLVVPADKPQHVTIGPGFDLVGLLGSDGRVATGDPAHVPIGIYAGQALKQLGVWDAVAPRLARTDDVRAALLLVERGEARAGIVYATDAAVSKGVMVAGAFPSDSHDPVSYPFGLTKSGDTPEARALMVFLAGPRARGIFVKYGFKVE
jgi:molybdate transport system substrate-binding protein